MQLPNGITTNKEVFLGLDWSRGLMDVYDGKEWHEFASLPDVAKAFPNSVLFLEATAESFELQKRKEALEAFAKHDVEAYCFPTRWTAAFRKEHNIEKGTDGKNDAKAIRDMCMTSRRTLCRFKERTTDPLGTEINKFLVHDRYACDGDETRKLAEKHLQDYPAKFAEFMKSNKKFRKQVGRFVAAAVEVRKAGKGFREFRRQVGNYAQGYGRMTRSEFYWWWTRPITKARLNVAAEKVEKDEDKTWWGRMTNNQRKMHKAVLKEADNALKYIWKTTA